jgi:hypothetical protein
LISIVLLFSSRMVNAMWVEMSQAELVENSALIVIGKLIGTTEVSTDAQSAPLHLGVLQVSDVLKGPSELKTILLLLPDNRKPLSSSDIIYRIDQHGLWFLRTRSGTTGIYLADSPQRFLQQEKIPEGMLMQIRSRIK